MTKITLIQIVSVEYAERDHHSVGYAKAAKKYVEGLKSGSCSMKSRFPCLVKFDGVDATIHELIMHQLDSYLPETISSASFHITFKVKDVEFDLPCAYIDDQLYGWANGTVYSKEPK